LTRSPFLRRHLFPDCFPAFRFFLEGPASFAANVPLAPWSFSTATLVTGLCVGFFCEVLIVAPPHRSLEPLTMSSLFTAAYYTFLFPPKFFRGNSTSFFSGFSCFILNTSVLRSFSQGRDLLLFCTPHLPRFLSPCGFFLFFSPPGFLGRGHCLLFYPALVETLSF